MKWLDHIMSKLGLKQQSSPVSVKNHDLSILLKTALAHSQLFKGFTDSELAYISHYFHEINLPADTIFIHEHEKPTDLYVLAEGKVGVFKFHDNQEESHQIATLEQGDIIGELALLEEQQRTATIRTLTPSTLLTISLETLHELLAKNPTFTSRAYHNVAKILKNRLKVLNTKTVEALKQKLENAQKLVSMGNFMVNTLLGIFIYVFIMRGADYLSHSVVNTTIISIPLLLFFGIYASFQIWRSDLPLQVYGFSTKNVFAFTMEAIAYSIPLCLIIVLIKWYLIHHIAAFTNEPLFNNPIFGPNTAHITKKLFFIMSICYTLAIPIQEIINRSVIQGSLQTFLTSRYKTQIAILLSSFAFSMFHIHFSIWMSIAVFPLSLFWGWLYARQNNIISVIVSHMIIGIWTMEIVNINPIL